MYNDCACNDCKKQMDTLRALDFSIQETVLFLNAYPECCEALSYYHSLIEQRAQLIERYETNCAPLTMYGNRSHTSWDWVIGPWPWETEAN